MKYRLVIFDFDGTLANSFPWFISIVDHLADRYKFKRLDKDEIENLRHFSAMQMIKQHEISLWKLLLLSRYLRRLMEQEIHKIPLFPGVNDLLQACSAQGITTAVVSSNTYANIAKVLGTDNLQGIRYFECKVPLYGKTRRLKKILRQSGIAAEETLCIGDEIRDIVAAQKAHIPFGAVSWGYTHIDALLKHQPDLVLTSMEQTIQLLTG